MATYDYVIQQKLKNGDMLTLHPQTKANVVLYDSTNAGDSGTVQYHLYQLLQKINSVPNDVVSGVKGNAETSYRKGEVNITPANIGTLSTEEINSMVNQLDELISSISATANEALSVAKGRARAFPFETYEDMTLDLKNASNTKYQIGDNLFIKDTDVPDYWISNVFDTNTGDFGYYEISFLETQKVDLTSYQPKEDKSLQTPTKTIVAGINEAYDAGNTALEGVKSIMDGSEIINTSQYAINSGRANSALAADKWNTPRTVSINGDAVGSTTMDGSDNAAINLILSATGVTAGVYSAVNVDAKGRVTAGSQVIEIGADGQVSPSVNLAVGGIFFKKV